MAYIKLDREALRHNLDQIDRKSEGRFAVVLKDNAYGHGLMEIAQEVSSYGVKRAVVRTRSEAVSIEGLFEYILILSDSPQEDGFYYAINDLQSLKNAPKKASLELKIDTGMHRNGIGMEEIEEALEVVKGRGLKLKGVFTHFRSADELGSELFWQIRNWKQVKERVKKWSQKEGYEPPHFHSANSAALFRAGIAEDEFARVGIALYGYVEFDEVFDMPPLQPVLSLWAKKIATRELLQGQKVGYGGEFEAPSDMRISTYDIGYADGIFRSLKMTKEGKILGRVSMDSIVLEGEKEDICIFDDAKEIARELGTISYEVLVKLSPAIVRH
ncbi:MAG: alanine racemase [Epsilonproteobacteria bacterium]|nr:alanine racemase [Campylobacterota bacterium]NPA64898.1 alanine racemase [Campylobacterota bacterium]